MIFGPKWLALFVGIPAFLIVGSVYTALDIDDPTWQVLVIKTSQTAAGLIFIGGLVWLAWNWKSQVEARLTEIARRQQQASVETDARAAHQLVVNHEDGYSISVPGQRRHLRAAPPQQSE